MVCVSASALSIHTRPGCGRTGLVLWDCRNGTPSCTCTRVSYHRYRDPLPALPVCTGVQMLPWPPWPVPRLRRIGNKPAWIRQTVRRDTRRGSVSRPLRAGSLLLGASFFSYRNSELGLGHVYQLVIGFCLNLCLQELSLQLPDPLLKLYDVGVLLLLYIDSLNFI